MRDIVYLALLLILAAASIWVILRERREKTRLQAARDKIKVEEDHVFEFLQGLGAAFSGDIRAGDLHRLIVEGATRILDAHGGTIYTISRDGQALFPAYFTKGCPLLIEVPNSILEQAETVPQALQSYLRLHAIERNEGLVGEVWVTGEPCLLSTPDHRLTPLHDNHIQTGSAMLAPLSYAGQNLGVLAVANGQSRPEFSDSDFAVFKAIAGQAAFALYNAIIYSQAAEKRRLDLDLEVAKDIQRILLPSNAPEVNGFEITGLNLAAQQVSGDYFDYIRIDDHHLGVAIADVSGKGVPASLMMAMCRSVLRSESEGRLSAAEVLHKVNQQLYPDIKEDMFISMAYVILGDESDTVTICRAGHDAPMFYSSKDRAITRINPPGMALGIDRGGVFDRLTGDFSQTLESGDCLVLYTDGVTEALDSKGREFGTKRMMQSIQAGASGGAHTILKHLTDDLRKFIGRNPQNDDITLIIIRRT